MGGIGIEKDISAHHYCKEMDNKNAVSSHEFSADHYTKACYTVRAHGDLSSETAGYFFCRIILSYLRKKDGYFISELKLATALLSRVWHSCEFTVISI